MKRSGIASLVFGLLCPCACFAQSSTPPVAVPVSSTIVTVNFNAAVLATNEAQKDLDALQKKYAPREQRLRKLNEDIETSKKLASDSSIKLNDNERNQRLQELSTKDKQFNREAEDFKNDSQSESQQIFQRVAQKFYAFLQQYAQQHAYRAVLERGTDTSPVVWYAAKDFDITEQVIKSYNTRPDADLPEMPQTTHTPQGNAPKQP